MTHEDVIERWLDVLAGKSSPRTGRPLENYAGSNVFGRGDTLYSFGRHFPLAVYYGRSRNGAGRYLYGRTRPLFLLNGDRFSVSTDRHQWQTRAAIERRAPRFGADGADVLLVPFSALDAAGIVRETIRPLEVRPDEWFEVEHTARTLAHVPLWIARRFEWRVAETLADVPADVAARGWSTAPYANSGASQWIDRAGAYHWRETIEMQPDADGNYRWTTREHRLGDSVFTAEVQTTRRRRVTRETTVLDVVRAAVADLRTTRVATGRAGTILALPLLGDTVTETETTTTRARRRFVSSFDANEPAPLYFLATLPRTSRARTVESAIADLAPAAVHAAILRGREVLRQGDIFAIETDLETVPDEWQRARLTQLTRGARARRGELGFIAPLTAAERREVVRRARRAFRRRWHIPALAPSSLPGARRRFAEVAATRADRLERARLAGRAAILRADTAVAGLGVSRQRAMYARQYRDDRTGAYGRADYRDRYRHLSNGTAAADLWRECYETAFRELRPAARPERVARRRADVAAFLSVHGTAHTATEVARAPGGAVYVRGVMRQSTALEPGRRIDHRPLPLGDGTRWYLAVRNTVPRQSDTRR